ncbi:hypothetical protein MCHI_003207 [Candidatus Magnetoovum chiemensis]|nr:hypothetical protein MCHI_003207 [Candidatus Magnetoovum chiemensis]
MVFKLLLRVFYDFSDAVVYRKFCSFPLEFFLICLFSLIKLFCKRLKFPYIFEIYLLRAVYLVLNLNTRYPFRFVRAYERVELGLIHAYFYYSIAIEHAIVCNFSVKMLLRVFYDVLY